MGSSIGKKIAMALSGLLLFGFIVGHLAGNLKIFQGGEKFDAYARFLREVGAPLFGPGELLWVARFGLLAAVAVHVVAAFQLTAAAHRARGARYKRFAPETFSYASRTMRWGGVILGGYVVYHLMHLTWGNAHPSFSHESAYANVVAGFQAWPVVAIYAVAQVALGLHLYHGLWSATRTLALSYPVVRRWRRPAAAVVSGAIVAGYLSIPVAVLAGMLR